MKKLVAVLLTLALLCMSLPAFAAVMEDMEFTWNGKTLRIAQIAEGDAVDAGNSAPEGKFVEMTIATKLLVTYVEIPEFEEKFLLMDKVGTAYSPVSIFGTLGESASLDKLNAARLSDITVRFDVPKEQELSELTLYVCAVPIDDEIGIPAELVGDLNVC